jgi:hypothetical protein
MSELIVHSGICVSRSWNRPGSRLSNLSTPRPSSTHPRGIPTIHLSKSTKQFSRYAYSPNALSNKHLRASWLCYSNPTSRIGEADNSVAFQSVNRCRKVFSLRLVLRLTRRKTRVDAASTLPGRFLSAVAGETITERN